jgi:hypothetical protein
MIGQFEILIRQGGGAFFRDDELQNSEAECLKRFQFPNGGNFRDESGRGSGDHWGSELQYRILPWRRGRRAVQSSPRLGVLPCLVSGIKLIDCVRVPCCDHGVSNRRRIGGVHHGP